VNISEITDEFVQINSTETAEPIKGNVTIYRELQAIQDELSTSVREVFTKHRQFLLR
jgi:xylulokinase